METFSFKSRDLSLLEDKALKAQMMADASEALGYYGETLDIRRPSLQHLGTEVPVHRVRLIYEGGTLKPRRLQTCWMQPWTKREEGSGSGGAVPMKMLEFHDLKPEDSLTLTFEGAFDQQAALERELEPFLQALEEYAGEWMPDVVEGKRRRKYSRAAIWKALEEERDENSTTIGLYRTKWPALDMSLRLHFPPLPPELRISLGVQPLSFFAEAERCRKFVEMVRAWASRYPVPYASAHSSGGQRSWRTLPTSAATCETSHPGRVRQDLRGVLAQRLRPEAGGDRRAASACCPRRPTGWRRSPTAPSSW